MTVKELKAELDRRGIPYPPKARKADLELLLEGTSDTVLAAVDRDIAVIAGRDRSVAGSTLAATVRALARVMDDPDTSATAKSLCAKALRDTLDRLMELAPINRSDRLDELARKRERRRAA